MANGQSRIPRAAISSSWTVKLMVANVVLVQVRVLQVRVLQVRVLQVRVLQERTGRLHKGL